MPLAKFEGFIGGSNAAGGTNVYTQGAVANQRLINLLKQKDEGGGGRDVLVGRPGITTFVNSLASPCRGIFSWEERMFAVGNSTLYEITSGGVVLNRGDVGSDGLPVEIYLNGAQLFIISAGYGWVYEGGALNRAYVLNGEGVVNTSGTNITWVSGDQFTADMASVNNRFVINDINYVASGFVDATHLSVATSAGVQTGVAYRAYLALKATSGGFVDGYFLAAQPTSGTPSATDAKTVLFNYRDAAFWDPLNFFVKESQPDNLVGIFVDHEEVYLSGSKTTEVYHNTGSEIVFERNQGATIEHGLAALHSVAKLGTGDICMLARSERGGPYVIRVTGYRPTRISTPALEAELSRYGDVSNAVAFSYEEHKQQLYFLSFPNADMTWIYDVHSGLWSECSWLDPSNGQSHRHRGAFHCYVWSKHYMGDWQNGVIYESSMRMFSDGSGDIKYTRRMPHLSDSMQRTTYKTLVLDAETGTVPSGSAPQAQLTWSDNDGLTWATAKPAGMGTNNQKGLRMKWNRLGQARKRVFEISLRAQCQQAWVGCYVDATQDGN